ncbi:Isopentenyl phosphate kinase [uncultured archaeon]|nr:Isopentenyl phosphate kinase [uncultured archaeon]
MVGALADRGVPAISVPPISIIESTNRRISSFNKKEIFDLLEAGYLPVLYGDMVPDRKLCYSVCSGDQIIAHLGKKAERVVMVSNVDGVMACGKVVPLITRRNFSKISKHLGCSSAADVTGGMAGKVREIMKSGATTYITNASHPERMVALLLGKKAACTKIVP